MKKFLTVLEYELKEYFSSKGFMIFTILLALGGALLLCLPRVIDMSDITGVVAEDVVEEEQAAEDVADAGDEDEASEEAEIFYLMDAAGITDMAVLESYFPEAEWVTTDNESELMEAVENETAEAGFIVKSANEYDYVVYNMGMSDYNSQIFDEAMKLFYRMDYCEANQLDFAEITTMYETPITMNTQVLNKDTGMNYWYCYILVIIVFMLIVMYGQMIAVSVTTEKSNRAIEVLVTSTTPNSLLFGKVIAGAIGGLFQAGLVLGAILLSYQFNREQWGGMLDMFFNIPGEVILTFAVFGMGGYLFYAFLYGAMGALVSKTEDVSKSSSGLMTVIMVVYFFSLFQLTNVDGPIIKVLSFLPFSSYSTMFARIAMGTVAPWEIVLSAIILIASIFGAGVLGAKLYRMGTLRYGNPIKLSTALKSIRKAE